MSEYNIPADALKIEDVPDCIYSKNAIEPEIKLAYKNIKLTKNDYEIVYVNNTNVGKANVNNP